MTETYEHRGHTDERNDSAQDRNSWTHGHTDIRTDGGRTEEEKEEEEEEEEVRNVKVNFTLPCALAFSTSHRCSVKKGEREGVRETVGEKDPVARSRFLERLVALVSNM